MQKVIFRVDASTCAGGGHAVRSLALADQFAEMDWTCLFALEAEALATVPALGAGPHEILVLPTDPDTLDERAEAMSLRQQFPNGVDALVIDSYRHGTEFEAACRGWAQCLVSIDGTMRAHDVDLLVNANMGQTRNDFADLVPDECEVLSGPKYAMLRRQFAALRASSLSRRKADNRKVERILVSFGASDPSNMTPIALGALQSIGTDAHIDVVLGANQAAHNSVLASIKNMELDIEVHQWVEDMPDMMARADVFIAAAGSSSWEACTLGLPSVIVAVADNQIKIAENLALTGAAISLGRRNEISAARVEDGIRRILFEHSVRNNMVCNSSSVCDGQGSRRVAEVIDELAA